MTTNNNMYINGIIPINKPQNWTSHDCVAVVRRVLHIKRVGHTGTLDPMATGVLPICVGTATRITEYMDRSFKEYKATLKLGITTDTQDIWGEVLSKCDIPDTSDKKVREKINEIFDSFKGEISQIPPKYSAIKVAGKKLYEYAREGKEVEIKPRKVFINRIEILNISGDTIDFTVECSKGTYIRSICHDIGEKLGCGAAMSALVRTKAGGFLLKDCIDIEDIKEMTAEELRGELYKTDYPLSCFDKIFLSKKQARDFVNGKKIREIEIDKTKIKQCLNNIGNTDNFEDKKEDKSYYTIYFEELFLGVATLQDGFLKADKVFDVRMQNEDI